MHKMFYLLSVLVLILSNASSLNAANYNQDILDIYAKMIPRLVIMSSQKNKIKDSIDICIIHDKLDKAVASSLSQKVSSNYPKGLSNYPIKLLQSDSNGISKCKDATLLYMLSSNIDEVEKGLLFSKKNSILTVSYNSSLLDIGVDISLFIGRKVVPYINMQSLKDKKIILDNLLLRVSKVYRKSEK